jgi:hypothetical protein
MKTIHVLQSVWKFTECVHALGIVHVYQNDRLKCIWVYAKQNYPYVQVDMLLCLVV